MASSPAPLPQILCLHGGGTSALIFKIQLRNLAHALRSHFTVLYLDGPFPSSAGPGVLPVFAECGPYYRWMPPEDYSSRGTGAGVREQEAAAEKTRRRIVQVVQEGRRNGEGEVVGVLGFSQGGKMAAGLLADQEEGRSWEGMPRFRFGVLLCASYPPYSISNAGRGPDEWPEEKDGHGIVEPPGEEELMGGTPSVHVRGLLDQHLEKGRRLSKYFVGEKEELEFEMGHYLPQAAGDEKSGGVESTNMIRDAILKVWRGGRRGDGVLLNGV